MSTNVSFIGTTYSKVNKPDNAGIYEYNLEFFFEGFPQPFFGVHISAFFSMKNMDTNEVADLLACRSTFKFLANTLTEEDVMYLLQTTHDQLVHYPLAVKENIADVLHSFPTISHQSGTFSEHLQEWFQAHNK